MEDVKRAVEHTSPETGTSVAEWAKLHVDEDEDDLDDWTDLRGGKWDDL